MVHCRKVHTPHIKRKVDMISAVTSSRSPAQMYVLTMIGMEMVELMLRSTCWAKQAERSQLDIDAHYKRWYMCMWVNKTHAVFSTCKPYRKLRWRGGMSATRYSSCRAISLTSSFPSLSGRGDAQHCTMTSVFSWGGSFLPFSVPLLVRGTHTSLSFMINPAVQANVYVSVSEWPWF